MKLIFTPNPNYIHKALVTAHEAGVLDRLELERQVPFDEDTEIWRYNPLGKVPAFLRDDGQPLFGGLVICEYLDSFNTTAPLFPKDDTRWTALRQMITGDGVFDATTLIRVESWRPKEIWHIDYMQRERRKIFGALDMLEQDAKSFSADVFHIGHVCIAGGLSSAMPISNRAMPIGTGAPAGRLCPPGSTRSSSARRWPTRWTCRSSYAIAAVQPPSTMTERPVM